MKFITLKVYANYIDAHIAQGHLEEEGITCWLSNEHSATIWSGATLGGGGVRLMVEATQLEQARQILGLQDPDSHEPLP